MSNYPNERDCQHGHKRGKCDTCDLAETEQQLRDAEDQLSEFHRRIVALEARVREVEVEKSLCDENLGGMTAKFSKAERELAKLKSHVEDFIRDVTADPDATLNWEDVPALLESIEKGLSEYRDNAAKAEKERASHVESLNSLIQLWNLCHSWRREPWTPETFFDHSRVTLKRALQTIEHGVDADKEPGPLQTYGRTDALESDLAAARATIGELVEALNDLVNADTVESQNIYWNAAKSILARHQAQQ